MALDFFFLDLELEAATESAGLSDVLVFCGEGNSSSEERCSSFLVMAGMGDFLEASSNSCFILGVTSGEGERDHFPCLELTTTAAGDVEGDLSDLNFSCSLEVNLSFMDTDLEPAGCGPSVYSPSDAELLLS